MRIIPDDSIGVVVLIQEAEGESYKGKVMVAEVIQRRAREHFMSDGTVVGTVMRPFQFSGMNTDAKNRIRSFLIDDKDPVVQECIAAWKEAKAGTNLVPGCLHYFNPKIVMPYWATGAKTVAEEGGHRFIVL